MEDSSEVITSYLERLNLTPEQIQLTKELSIILIPLLITALLFFFSGWYFRSSKRKKNTEDNSKTSNHYKEKYTELYNLTQGKKVKRKSSLLPSNEENPIHIETNLPKEEVVLEEIQESSTDFEDLTKIEGITPKIQYILKINGIDSFEKLANTPTETLEFLLEKYGGSAYKIYNPSDWNTRAKELTNPTN